MSDEYQKALKRERDRERSWRKTDQGAFESSFYHVDFQSLEDRELNNVQSWLSDNGAGADAIIDAIDGEIGETYYERRLNSARRQIRKHLRETLGTFDLIVKNGRNREDSICEMM